MNNRMKGWLAATLLILGLGTQCAEKPAPKYTPNNNDVQSDIIW